MSTAQADPPTPEASEAPAVATEVTPPDRLGVPSILERGPGGSYVYRGSGFDARIAPNGTVTMRNRYGRLGIMAGTFDLTAMAEAAAGNDPYLSERRAFMDTTRSFRETLIVRADAMTLLRQLSAIRFDGRLSIAQRRARTFAVWDDMVEDEKGAEGRRILTDFVRSQYTGVNGFRPDELQVFNAHRRSREAFEP
ncbi:MAG: hypothetical protein QM778_34300 [Myxococcales bacterium]